MGAIHPLAAGSKVQHARSRRTEEAAAARDRGHGGGDCYSDEGNGKRENSEAGRPSRETVETRTSTKPDHLAGASPTQHPHQARGKVSQQWKDAVIPVLHKKGDKTKWGTSRGFLLVSHAGKVLLKVVARRLSTYCEAKGLLPE